MRAALRMKECKDRGAFVGDKLDPGHFPLDGDRIVPGNLLPVSEALGSGQYQYCY